MRTTVSAYTLSCMRSARHCLVVVIATCLACGARSQLSMGDFAGSDAASSSDTSPGTTTLSIALGTYTGCTIATLARRPNLVGATGGAGSITLRREGDAVIATLAFPPFASGAVAFVPTTGSSAAFRASQTFDAQIIDTSVRVVTVTATSGALSLVGSTLFVSTHGTAGDDDVSTFFHCHVPTGLIAEDIVTRTPPPGHVTAGTYRSCTASSSTDGPIQAGISGGIGAVTLSENAGTLRLTWPDTLLGELTCNGLDFAAGPIVATLTGNEICTMHQPCGPPPTLGMSPYPSTATLTDLRGAMSINGGTLFIDVLGDAGSEACGVHDISITCPGP